MADEIRIRSQALADELFEMYTSGDPFNDGAVLGVCQRHLSEATARLRARIEKLEGLGPLIEELEQAIVNGYESFRIMNHEAEYQAAKSLITEVLKGGGT